MAWTAPITWVPGQVPTAASLNAQLRDNLLETMVAKATEEGQYFSGAGLNTIAARKPQAARLATSQSTTSTSYTDLSTVGPSVTVTHGAFAIIFISCRLQNSATNEATYMSWDMTGSNVRGALDITAIQQNGVNGGNTFRIGNVDFINVLTPGTTTFTCKYKVTAGTGTFSDRFIAVLPL